MGTPVSFMALALASIAAGGVDDCPGARTLEAADLAGIVEITDILRSLPGVSWSTTDGFDLRPHAGGVAPAGEAPWLVLIDGVPVTTGPFGAVDFHLLPVEPSEIIRVVHCPGPAIAAGRFAGAGTLEITTSRRRGTPGWGSMAEARVGNETGDPGPRRYLPEAAPNVDKIGPDVALVVLSPVVTASGRFERRYPGEPATFDRNADALGRFPAVRYGTVGLHVGHPRSPLRLDAGATYASDLWYLESAGRELPVRRLGALGALSAGVTVRGVALGVRAAANAAHLDRRPEMVDSAFVGFDPRWREFGGALDLEVRVPRRGRSLAAGTHVSGTTASGPDLADGRMGLMRIWLHQAGDGRAGWHPRSDIAVVVGADDVGFEIAGTVERIGPGGTLSVRFSRDDRIPEENPGSAFWRARGYTGLDRVETDYAPAPTIMRGTERSLRADALAHAGAGVTLRASVAGRDFRDFMLERGDFRPDSVAGVAGAGSATGRHHGRLISVLMAADASLGRWRWDLSYRLERIVDGDAGFRDAWGTVPVHLGRGRVSLRPDPSLLLRTAVEARSATRWQAYEAFDGVAFPGGFGEYRSRVPPAVVVDLDLEKSLLGGRLTLTASLRNLLNAPERAHPLGATLAFRMWTRVRLRL